MSFLLVFNFYISGESYTVEPVRVIHIIACSQFVHSHCSEVVHCERIYHNLFNYSAVDEYLSVYTFQSTSCPVFLNTKRAMDIF